MLPCRCRPAHTASRAARYCRSLKISVTLSVMPAAASSSSAPRPASVAGTLIIRLTCPSAQRLPSSTYFFERSAMEMPLSGSSSSGSSSKLTQPVLPRLFSQSSLNSRAASLVSLSVIAQAMASSSWPSSMNFLIVSSKRPVAMSAAMIAGLLVAPLMPRARFFLTSSGSTESSQRVEPASRMD